ncbi:hypothetical protein [Deinococcus maricopensis]|uniref:Uncharacterized protein n=1 Tax=Deinococcus maricopensis (strain DSM 21211 / LMG 22137 / NRRL B-23946 / LB-34) TaxID=709986 RepID=E8U6J3_DEIML|nr:hypothetical protein [Deinococcus maricopensis]ADV66682.1 hypothetical protein Deima_1029 [Deinococcus maricopensis DSM 21211]
MNTETIARTTRQLIGGLTAYQILQGFFGGLAVLALLFVGVMGVGVGGLGLDASERAVLGALTVPFLLLAVAYAALFILSLLVIGWAKGWHARIRDAALGAPADPHLQVLRGTLGRWITFYQWLSVVTLALVLLAVLGGGTLISAIAGASDLTNGVSSGLVTFFVLIAILLFAVPSVILNWLILASIRRYLNAATDRALGAPVAVMPAATTVGNWFVFLLVLVGLGLVSQLFGSLAGIAGSFLPSTSDSESVPLLVTLPSAVFSVLMYVLQFLLVLWSRTLALNVAAAFDARPQAEVPMDAPTGLRLDK